MTVQFLPGACSHPGILQDGVRHELESISGGMLHVGHATAHVAASTEAYR